MEKQADQNRLPEGMTVEQGAAILSALRMCSMELRTLVPRLGGAFQKNAQTCVDASTKALADVGLKP